MLDDDLKQKITETHTDVRWIKEALGTQREEIDDLKEFKNTTKGALGVIGFILSLLGIHAYKS